MSRGKQLEKKNKNSTADIFLYYIKYYSTWKRLFWVENITYRKNGGDKNEI